MLDKTLLSGANENRNYGSLTSFSRCKLISTALKTTNPTRSDLAAHHFSCITTAGNAYCLYIQEEQSDVQSEKPRVGWLIVLPSTLK